MRPFNRLSGFVMLILKRQRHQYGLTLLALVSIILAVGLVTSPSFFTQAVDRVILAQNLKDFSKTTGRPALSTSVDYVPSTQHPTSVTEAETLAKNVASIMANKVGIPVRHQGLQISGGGMLMQPDKSSSLYSASNSFLETVELVYIADVGSHIQVTEGKPFNEKATSSGDVVDVWIHDTYAQQLGAKVGDIFTVGVTLVDKRVKIRLAGFWHSSGPDNNFWFNNPDTSLDTSLLISRDDYIRTIQPLVPSKIREVYWYIILDENKVKPGDSAKYVDGFKQATTEINRYLPGVRLNTPPLDPLQNTASRSNSMTVLLLGYNLPAFFILLYFLILSASIVARWQRKDMSLLVSRGMSIGGVLNLVMLDQLMLFVVGYPIGILLGMLIARVMGYSTGFLAFGGKTALPVSFGDASFPLTLLALAISLIARLWPAAQVARDSKKLEEREWAKTNQLPFWYRYYIDVILIAPTYYAYSQMTRHGSLGNLLVNNKPDDLYQDPLLILLPALFIITASLLIMRLFSLVMRLIDFPAKYTPWLTLHLALRQLSRQSDEYLRPLMLVVVTLALGIYTLSMSASLDRWLIDRNYYKAGADFTFRPMPLNSTDEPSDSEWLPPMEDLMRINGVVGATRVSKLFIEPSEDLVAKITEKVKQQDQEQPTGQNTSVKLLALDRSDFASVAWYRSDFSQESLGALMNRLAATPNGVLAPRVLLTHYGLQIGDRLPVNVGLNYSTKFPTELIIVGTYDYFPTVYQEDGITLIGNLDNLTDVFGFAVPYRIWMKLAPGADPEVLMNDITANLQFKGDTLLDSRGSVSTEQNKVDRIGILGTLSIGFLSTAAMAIIGLLIYSNASLRERVYHLAMLLAVGVSRTQIIAQVVLEYTFLTLFGVAAGGLIGVGATYLFVPFFRFAGENGIIPLPPLLPVIDWQGIQILTITFSVVIVAAELVTITLSIRNRIGQLLKGV
jgi:putative ABC transport system permease protein